MEGQPGSSQRASGATLVEELVLRPVEGRFGGLAWRVNEGATYSTDVLAARCNTLLEQWVLEHGYLEIVALRNRLARALGYRDYFDYKVRKHDRMSPGDLFAMLDEFLSRTGDANRRGLDALKAQYGEAAVRPWNPPSKAMMPDRWVW